MDPAPPPETEDDDEETGWISRLEPHIQRLLVVFGVVGLVVGLLVGFAGGFKLEQHLDDNDANAKADPPKAAARKIASLGGVVTEQATNSINIASANDFRVKIRLLATLAVKKAVKASLTDITVGSTILERGAKVGTGKNDAAEIIVLPGDSRFKGLKVTAVNGDKVNVVRANTKPLTVNVKSTTAIYKLHASSATRIAKGSEIVAKGSGVFGSGTFDANEIIILAPGSAFANK